MILMTALILSMALLSYGKAGDKNTSLFKSLTTAMKNAQTSATFYNGTVKKTVFLFNEKSVNAFFDEESNDLIGFSIPMAAADLPAGSMGAIQKKYADYSFLEAIMFIGKDGKYGWYISMSRDKKPTIVLSLDAKGKAHYYTKM